MFGEENFYNLRINIKVILISLMMIAFQKELSGLIFISMEEGNQSILPLLVASYAGLSLFFFAFPTLLRRARPLMSNHFLRIAHRGGARLFPENTLLAFKKSAPLSDMLQLDVCLTKDGVLVVHHDKQLSRSCGVHKEIGELTYQELPPLKSEIDMDFSETPAMIKTNSQKIPTLQQLFLELSQTPIKFNIQLKTGSRQALFELKRVITKYNRVQDCLLGVVKPWEKALEEIFPESNRFISYGKLNKLILLYVTGLLPFVQIEERALQIPLYSQGYYQMKLRSSKKQWKVKAMFSLLKKMEWIIRPLAWHLKKRGIMTLYWVLNTEQQFRRAEKAYASGIMTDNPNLLNTYLKHSDQQQK